MSTSVYENKEVKANKNNKEDTVINKVIKIVKRDWQLYLFLLPIIIWMALWVYKPLGGVFIAFKNYQPDQGVLGSKFVGLGNFKTLMFSNAYAAQFWTAFRNTFTISLYGLVFGFPIPILLALLFSEITHEPYKKLTQTIAYLPHFISEVIITGLVLTMLYSGADYKGILTRFLELTKLVPVGSDSITERAAYFRPMYIITGMWKEAGYNSIVYFAAIMSISPVLYEALRVDGGNKMQEIRYITFPGMAPTLIITIILRIGRMLSVGYERVLLLYKPNTYSTGDVISTFVFRLGIEGGNRSLAGAADLFNSLIGLALVLAANMISRRVSDTSLW